MAKRLSTGIAASIDTGVLAGAARRVASIVGRKTTIPICGTTRLAFSEGKIVLTATDLDREISETIAANVSGVGAVCVNAHNLSGVLNKAPARSQLSLSMDGNRIKLKYGSAIAKLDTFPAEDFPSFIAADASCTWQMPAGDFLRILNGVIPAVSHDESRFYLNGVFLHILEHQGARLLAAAATDGHRCCRRTAPIPDGLDDLPPMIVPSDTVKSITQICDKADDAITVSVSNSFIRVEAGGTRLVSKLIDGTFPDYQRVIPETHQSMCVIQADELAAAIQRVATIASDKVKGLAFIFEQGRVRLGTETPDSGVVVEELESEFSGPRIEIGFNGGYLAEALGKVSGDACLRIDGPSSPIVVSSKGNADELPPDIEVVMPTRIACDIERHFDDTSPTQAAA